MYSQSGFFEITCHCNCLYCPKANHLFVPSPSLYSSSFICLPLDFENQAVFYSPMPCSDAVNSAMAQVTVMNSLSVVIRSPPFPHRSCSSETTNRETKTVNPQERSPQTRRRDNTQVPLISAQREHKRRRPAHSPTACWLKTCVPITYSVRHRHPVKHLQLATIVGATENRQRTSDPRAESVDARTKGYRRQEDTAFIANPPPVRPIRPLAD